MFISLLYPQWTSGLWAASWQRCCKENHFSKEEIVSLHKHLLAEREPSEFQTTSGPLNPLTPPGVQIWIS